MAGYYLLRHDGTISDIHYIGAPPEPRPEGQWIDGSPALNAPIFESKTILQRLIGIFSGLADDEQVAFGTLAASVYMFLQVGNDELAKLAIQSVSVPVGLQAKKAELLAVFDA